MKIRPLEAELLFHADRQTDRQDEANSRIRKFAKAPKNTCSVIHTKSCVSSPSSLAQRLHRST